MVNVVLPNGKIITRKPTAKTIGNFCQMYIRYKNRIYAIGNGDEYIRGIPEIFKLNYLRSDSKMPQYVLYPEHKEEIKKHPHYKDTYYKNYIEV